jgi:putative SOS response-associated peptidase YedK
VGELERPTTRQPFETFTIITIDPNEVMQPIHTRMPVILRTEDYERWLAPVDPARPPTDFLRPSLVVLEAWKVDPRWAMSETLAQSFVSLG